MRIDFDNWYDRNYDKLEDEYLEYIDENTDEDGETIFVLKTWDEFVSDKFESAIGDYEDECYERFKERDI